ncbi:RNA polymerase, sigma-24 subunit, ECF subfamily [Catenulispora acidiphila DSM 44928]|uniref:RNA polymerase, sigma-24 subunit, ECF subfamily n=1 Tax=Catenulispora acidiphila (strain DSM 44928 / JCM 14897 / NBRC 102108 / NRRL B-24433 / ID139908) TaxID=479433 RepID=C7Q0K2_CATAD|nr:SigE family RNA polymerase sigma factor [Catenulispora acidiphila]ACU77535.1 RNA polymerase, sigma-24 subunit, ECF subfamily [Catenulispora acidiphila DSM 44928]
MTTMVLSAPECHRQSGTIDVADLYATHRLPLTRLAVLLLGDMASAEDAVQEVFVKLWSRPDLLQGVAAPSSYLRTAVVNRARSVQRRRKLEREYAVQDTRDVEPAETTALLPLEHREVMEAVQALPTRQREVLLLRYWADLTETEIARTLGVSRGTVKSTASRGMRAVTIRLRAGNA